MTSNDWDRLGMRLSGLSCLGVGLALCFNGAGLQGWGLGLVLIYCASGWLEKARALRDEPAGEEGA